MQEQKPRQDFESNARGMITEQQREALIKHHDLTLWLVGGWLLFLFGLGALWVAGQEFLQAFLSTIVGGATNILMTTAAIGAFILSLVVLVMLMEAFKQRYTLPKVESLAQKPIQLGNGSIEWKGKRLMGYVDGVWYPSVYGDDGEHRTITPGLYSIHYWQNPNTMLSVRRLANLPDASHNEVLQRSVARVNRFALAALPHNRAGWLTLGQRKRLLWHTLTSLVGLVITVVVAGVFLALFIFLSMDIETGSLRLPTLPQPSELLANPSTLLTVVVVAAVVGLMMMRFFKRQINTLRMLFMLLLGRVWQAEGPVSHYSERRYDEEGEREYFLHFYKVQALYFQVNEDAINMLPEGQQVRVYYLPLHPPGQIIRAVRNYILFNVEVL